MLDLWLAALLDSSLKGAALCLAAGAAALLLHRASAAARHLVWRLAFAGLLALPALVALLPQWRVPLPKTVQTAAPLPARESAVSTRPDPAPAFAASAAPGREPAVAPRGWNLSWPAAALGIWLAGALAVLGALGTALLRVRWQGRHARPITDEAWLSLLGRVRAELSVRRPVQLVEGDDRAMPMTWGWRRPVVLLPAGAGAWPEARRRAVLLHELAHIARGDFLTQLAAEVVRALYWLNPLVWVAARKLRMESEHACDDQVLRAGARASDYAGDLLDIARSFRAVRIAPAGLAMARPSRLAGRLLAVLDAHRDRRGIPRRLSLPSWLAAACVVLPLAAVAPAAERTARRPASPGHMSFSDDNGSQRFLWSQDGRQIRVRAEGTFELNEDWTAIVRLSRGATMRFEEDRDGVTRQLDVAPGGDGRPVYTWKVGGKERPFDAEARTWLQGVLQQFVRGSGYAAEERAAAIYRTQGPEGLLAEISQIPGDYVKEKYFAALLSHHDLEDAAVASAFRQAGQEMGSDYELAKVLLAGLEGQNRLGDPAVWHAFAGAVDKLQSDYERYRTLSAAVDGGGLSQEAVAQAIQSASGIHSDYQRATILVEIAGKYDVSGGARTAYLEAARSIQSQYQRERAEAALGERPRR